MSRRPAMLRFEISEHDLALPVVDVADDIVVLGSGPEARVRLPSEAAREAHVRFEGQTWLLVAEATVGGLVRAPGDSGAIGHGIVLGLGTYRVRVTAPPPGTPESPPQRTESLARELVRSLLGEGGAPTLEIEHGTSAGAKRMLAPPESALVIGRGDEAAWVILDEDLSRAHAEVRRGWDGVTAVDLGSKNGTRVDGVAIGRTPVELRDGAALALGPVVMRFRDPAERHVSADAASRPRPVAAPPVSEPRRSSPWSIVGLTAIVVLALAALLWIWLG